MTCAFVDCAEAKRCALVGGCVNQRFEPSASNASDLKKGARKLVGTAPARTNRDPRFIKRNRKPLTK